MEQKEKQINEMNKHYSKEKIKEDLKNLVIDYIKVGLTHKEILKEMESVIYWELRDNGFLKRF